MTREMSNTGDPTPEQWREMYRNTMDKFPKIMAALHRSEIADAKAARERRIDAAVRAGYAEVWPDDGRGIRNPGTAYPGRTIWAMRYDMRYDESYGGQVDQDAHAAILRHWRAQS